MIDLREPGSGPVPHDVLRIFCAAAGRADLVSESAAIVAGWMAVKLAGWSRNSEGEWTKDLAVDEIRVDEPKTGDKVMPDKTDRLYKIVKIDDEQRMVYGWASVISINGEPVVDLQGDIIEPPELEKATTDFMKESRIALAMHERNGDGGIDLDMIRGQIVHSFPLVKDLMSSLGIRSEREGWIVGVHIADDKTWAKVKSGDLPAFSIGGAGDREAA